MTTHTSLAPLSEIPFDPLVLERQVEEMERMIDLVRRRDEAAATLSAMGVAPAFDQADPKDVIRLVAQRHSLSPDEIRRRGQTKQVFEARHEVFYLLVRQVRRDGSKRWSLPQIGRKVAHPDDPAFDHTSVLNGFRRHAERLRAAEADEQPRPIRVRRPRPNGSRPATSAATAVCMLPANEKCPGCGAAGDQPCLDGARRAG